MSINTADNFGYKGPKFNFERDAFQTLAEMKACPETAIPPKGFRAFCEETDKYYKFNIENPVDPTTGKWREDSADLSEVAFLSPEGEQVEQPMPTTADRAVADGEGNNITQTYAKKTELPSTADFATKEELAELESNIFSIKGGGLSKEYELKRGIGLNTTTPSLRFKTSIPSNTEFNLSVTTDEGTTDITCYIYNEQDTYELLPLKNGVKTSVLKSYKIVSIGFNIPSPTADGKATISVEYDARFDDIESNIDTINSDLYGYVLTKNYELKQGTSINTTPASKILNIEILANTEFKVQLSVTDESKTSLLYLKKEDASFDSFSIKTNEEQIIKKDFNITGIGFLISSPTKDGMADLSVRTKDGALQEITNIPQIEGDITELKNELSELYDKNYQREYALTRGQSINTTSPNLQLITEISENQYFTLSLSSTEETKETNLYLYKDSSNYALEKVQLGREILMKKDYKVVGIGFLISSPTADGTATLSVNAFSQISQNKKDIEVQKYRTQKLRLADAVAAWANGEKFPIGWHGDSTVDGIATTGWTTENSHPAQDEAAGGRGKADYICEKAYPYILEQMLKKEFNNQNLRMYNIGYYGGSLNNNYAQLKDIYGYVYSDVKMVGLSLSINDRTHYDTLSKFYNGVYDYLVKYVEFYMSKGIVPFMVLQQAVTQGGNDGTGAYKPLYQNYTQTLANKAKIEVARLYGLEVIDMNSFGFLLLNVSNYSHQDLTENLHFKDLGHKLEAEYLFSELVPWVDKTDGRQDICLGILSKYAKSDIALTGNTTTTNPTSDKFKQELNFTKSDTADKLIYEYYILNNSGQYRLSYLTPEASGYIMHNDVKTEINSTEVDLGVIDIGLHKLQIYSGETNKIAFKGFKLLAE